MVYLYSRQALKKYILANNKALASSSTAVFDGQFNKALRTGVEKGDFNQPKGQSAISPSEYTLDPSRSLTLASPSLLLPNHNVAPYLSCRLFGTS